MISGGGGVPSAGTIPKAAEWKFSQVFGERMAGEEVQDGKKWCMLSMCSCD